MSDDTPNQELLESVWAEARDLVKKLEGSTVQRLAVKAGDCKIEIERGAPAPAGAAPAALGDVAAPPGPVAPGAGPGMGISPGARGASGVFTLGEEPPDERIPVLAPLVGSFYEAAQPGAKPFVQVGDVVERRRGRPRGGDPGQERRSGRVRAGPDVPRAGRGLTRACSRRSSSPTAAR
jgi:biotin carboxyl carrier protein